MLLFDNWRLWQALFHEGGVLVTTVDTQGAGLRTLLQPDGDMCIGVSATLTDQEDLVRRHMADVAQALSVLRRLHRTLARYAVLYTSVGWHISGSMLEYARQGLGPHAGTRFAERFWLVEGGLVCLVLGAGWALQRLLPRWLGAVHHWWVALLTSAVPLLAGGVLSAYERWGCSVLGACPGMAAMHPALLPLLAAGALGLLRLLFKYAMRWYIRRTLGLM